MVIEMTSRAPNSGAYFGEKVIRFSYPTNLIARPVDIFKKTYIYERIIRSAIKKCLRPDVIISSWPTHDAVLLGYRLSRSLKVPLVLDIQDLADYYRGMLGKSFIDPLMGLLVFEKIYKAMSTARKIVTVTEPFKRIIELRTNRKDVELVYNGVDVQMFESIRRTIRNDFEKEGVVGVFLGDLSWRYHMLDTVLYALYILKKLASKLNIKMIKDLRVRVVGSGKYLPVYSKLTLRLGLNETISYTGYLEREDLVRTLILSDFGIIGRPAINNLWVKASMRSTIYEYMAAGLPVFSFGPESSYTQFFIKKNNLGMYISSDNPKSIATHMLKLLAILENFDRNAIRKLSELYDWSRLAKKFSTIVEELSS